MLSALSEDIHARPWAKMKIFSNCIYSVDMWTKKLKFLACDDRLCTLIMKSGGSVEDNSIFIARQF